MKYNKNTDNLLFLPLFTKNQRAKSTEKISVRTDAQER